MRVDQFNFDLPDEAIALRPASPRDAARMLVVKPGGALVDAITGDLPHWLEKGDAIVFNDTKVIPAQLEGIRVRDGVAASIGVTLHMRVDASRWKAFARGAKKLKAGDRVRFGHGNTSCLTGALDASVEEKGEAGEVTLLFDLSGAALNDAIAAVGHVPLPPYIALKRGEDERDRTDYQTLFAREEGAVAAPTAGLHFTRELMQRLAGRGVSSHFVTLHVGAGTFLPVKAQDTAQHTMHAERGVVSAQTADALNAACKAGGRIVCIGTTCLRLLESAADENGVICPFDGATSIFITPGYRFKTCDILLTNFHLPRSTLFMLVSAFSGLEAMRGAYRHAIENGYRFYSYGDASLLYRAS